MTGEDASGIVTEGVCQPWQLVGLMDRNMKVYFHMNVYTGPCSPLYHNNLT